MPSSARIVALIALAVVAVVAISGVSFSTEVGQIVGAGGAVVVFVGMLVLLQSLLKPASRVVQGMIVIGCGCLASTSWWLLAGQETTLWSSLLGGALFAAAAFLADGWAIRSNTK